MKQAAHTWIALRAIGLLQQDAQTQALAIVLSPWAKHSYIGGWLPDMTGFKKGHGIVDNHTFKNAPYHGPNGSRFILHKKKLLAGLDSSLALHGSAASPGRLRSGETNPTRPSKAPASTCQTASPRFATPSRTCCSWGVQP